MIYGVWIVVCPARWKKCIGSHTAYVLCMRVFVVVVLLSRVCLTHAAFEYKIMTKKSVYVSCTVHTLDERRLQVSVAIDQLQSLLCTRREGLSLDESKIIIRVGVRRMQNFSKLLARWRIMFIIGEMIFERQFSCQNINTSQPVWQKKKLNPKIKWTDSSLHSSAIYCMCISFYLIHTCLNVVHASFSGRSEARKKNDNFIGIILSHTPRRA